MNVINPKENSNSTQTPSENVSDFIIDFITFVRTLTIIPKTFKNLIWKIIKMLPVKYTTLHIVADSYREVSIKFVEWEKRESTPKVYENSVSSNVPREFQEFLKNGDNKSRLIELFFDYVILKRCKVLNDRRASKILLSQDGLCISVTLSSVTEMTDLSSNHE